MTTTKKVCGLAGCAIILLALLQHSHATTSDAKEIAVVVNGSNPVDDLPVPELRRILLGERRFWRGNVQIKLVLPAPGSRERERILADVLGMSPSEFGKHWRDKIFRGEAPDEPMSFPGEAGLTRYAKETPGALTFIARKNVDTDTKVLKLDGKTPGELGYVLK